jgi:tetratricopeptide (TPR) repeat protein
MPSKELAELLIHNGEDGAARDVLLTALTSNDACVCCRVLHGEVYTRQGEIGAAKREFEAALELEDEEVRALTGLSRIVDPIEAEQLIERAIAADPDDPRVHLARARLRAGDIEAQIRDGVRALELQSDFVEGHLFLAPLLVANGNRDEALNHLEAALSQLPAERELIPNFVAAAMDVARMGEGERLSKLLAEHQSGGAVEPLAIALQLARGEQPLVAKEVLEVAKDIAGIPQS